MPKLIYLVDDEASLSQLLKLYLNQVNPDWRVCCFERPLDAIEAAKTSTPDLVVSDFSMPEMTGVAMFEQIRQIVPQSVRILISGYADPTALGNKLMAAHQYLAKPFQMQEIKKRLQNALEALDRFPNPTVRKTVLGLKSLPAIPKVYVQLAHLLDDPECDYEKVVKILSEDCVLSSRILQMSNSPLFGRNGETITDLLESITILGTDRIKAAVLSHEVFKNYTNTASAAQMQKLNQHRWDTATKAYETAIQTGLSEALAKDAYVAGLMHDLGRLVLEDNFPKEYQQILATAKKQNKSLDEMELEAFGITQAQVIGFISCLWGMRPNVTEALTYQDNPSAASTSKTQAVAMALHIAHSISSLEQISEAIKQPELRAA